MCALTVAFTFASEARAHEFPRAAGGFMFAVDDTGTGQIESVEGERPTMTNAFKLRVNSMVYTARGADASISLDGRLVATSPVRMGPFVVTRYIYMNEEKTWIRILDVLQNVTTASETANIVHDGMFGSNLTRGWVLQRDSSGNRQVTEADSTFVIEPPPVVGRPPVIGIAFQGPTPSVRAATAAVSTDSVGGDFFNWHFRNVVVPARDYAAVLTFISFGTDVATVASAIADLNTRPAGTDVGIDEYSDQVINYERSMGTGPRIRFSGAEFVDEGETGAIMVSVMSAAGASQWTWDSTGRGTFGELPDAATYSFSAPDGPRIARIGVRAVSAGTTSERYRTLVINNVAPRIVSDPPAEVASIDTLYSYQFVVSDPAGAADPITYALDTRPQGMTITPTGLVQWTPTSSDQTTTTPNRVKVTISDDDGGKVTREWDLRVVRNRPPTQTRIIAPANESGIVNPSPRLVVQNSTDPDLETLSYNFEIDTSPMFNSPAHIVSGPQREGTAFTAWNVTTPLSVGRWYWRASVSDGTFSTSPLVGAFFVLADSSALQDAGPDAARGVNLPPDVPGGLRCDAADVPGRSSSIPHCLALALLGVAIWRSRRAAH